MAGAIEDGRLYALITDSVNHSIELGAIYAHTLLLR